MPSDNISLALLDICTMIAGCMLTILETMAYCQISFLSVWVKQGDVMSTNMFNIYINDLQSNLKETMVVLYSIEICVGRYDVMHLDHILTSMEVLGSQPESARINFHDSTYLHIIPPKNTYVDV